MGSFPAPCAVATPDRRLSGRFQSSWRRDAGRLPDGRDFRGHGVLRPVRDEVDHVQHDGNVAPVAPGVNVFRPGWFDDAFARSRHFARSVAEHPGQDAGFDHDGDGAGMVVPSGEAGWLGETRL